jgi:hypothetical protein
MLIARSHRLLADSAHLVPRAPSPHDDDRGEQESGDGRDATPHEE